MIVLGPAIRAQKLNLAPDGKWSLAMEYCANEIWHPYEIPIPGAVSRGNYIELLNPQWIRVSEPGGETKCSLIELLRTTVDYFSKNHTSHGEWVRSIIKNLFAYEVVYVGQAYGREGRRTAVDRLRAGHEHLLEILANVHDYRPDAAVGIITLDAEVGDFAMRFNFQDEDVESVSAKSWKILSTPDPLRGERRLVDACEALLIRYFQPAENKNLINFPYGNTQLVDDILNQCGFTHIAIDIDVSSSRALLIDPGSGTAIPRHRLSVNLKTAEREDITTMFPLF
jgi:hypothetical protein